MKYLTYLNSGCKDICDNMLISAEKVGINKDQFIVVAFDRQIHEYYENRGYSVELFRDVPEEKYYSWTWDETSGFRNLVKNKWVLIKKYFEFNRPLMWLDTDVVFLKNPEEHLLRIKKPTFQIDYPVRCACTGLMYFPNHEFSVEIIEKLGSQNKEDDQIVCNRLLETSDMKEKFEYFDPNEYPNGGYFYDALGTTVEKITMLHCNYIVGLENKITRLKRTGVWYL